MWFKIGEAWNNSALFLTTGLIEFASSPCLGPSELQPLLLRFGDLLEEIAVAQEMLAHSLDQSFILPLEQFCSKEMDTVRRRQGHSSVGGIAGGGEGGGPN